MFTLFDENAFSKLFYQTMSDSIIGDFMKFHELLQNNNLSFKKKVYNEVIRDFNFQYISEKNSSNEIEKRNNISNLKKSNLIIIDRNICLNENSKSNIILK